MEIKSSVVDRCPGGAPHPYRLKGDIKERNPQDEASRKEPPGILVGHTLQITPQEPGFPHYGPGGSPEAFDIENPGQG